MKKAMICLLLFGTTLTLRVQAQENKPVPKARKVFFGVSYTFNETTMKLRYLNEQFGWNGKPSEPRELNQEELDDLNSRETFTRRFQGLTLEAGMLILGKPDSPWHIDGSLMVGLASSRYRAWNNQIDTLAMEISSEFTLPTLGIHFNIAYKFTPNWGIQAMPHVAFSFGRNKNIDDNTYGHIENFEETRNCYYNYWYGRINLLATYTVKTFTVGLGPGFYVLYNTNDYTIESKNPATGDTYTTEVNTRLISKSFFDGNVAIEWRIIPALSVSALAAIGNDITVRGSVRYNF
jgi:hypothetical protein